MEGVEKASSFRSHLGGWRAAAHCGCAGATPCARLDNPRPLVELLPSREPLSAGLSRPSALPPPLSAGELARALEAIHGAPAGFEDANFLLVEVADEIRVVHSEPDWVWGVRLTDSRKGWVPARALAAAAQASSVTQALPVVQTPQASPVVQTPAALQGPASVQEPAAVHTPVAVQTPAVIQALAVVQAPAVVQTSAAVLTQTAAQVPAAVRAPVAMQLPASAQAPAGAQNSNPLR